MQFRVPHLVFADSGIHSAITYDYSYNDLQDPMCLYDLNEILLHCLRIDHSRLTYKYQGRHHRLINVHGEVVQRVLARVKPCGWLMAMGPGCRENS